MPHILLVLGAILIIGALFALRISEEQHTRDTIRMQEAIGIKSSIQLYYLNHAAYPTAPDGPLVLGGHDTLCLSDAGFVSAASESCLKKRYAYPIPAGYSYEPQQNDNSPCTSKTSCPRYAIKFFLESNLLAPKGEHALTPDALN